MLVLISRLPLRIQWSISTLTRLAPLPLLWLMNDWHDISLVFQSEHLKYFPLDGLGMPKYMELIRKMATEGIYWHYHDKSFRLARAKKIKKGTTEPSLNSI